MLKHQLILYLFIYPTCRKYAKYLRKVAKNAETNPRNKFEKEIEDIIFNSILTVSQKMGLEPTAIAVLSPYLRQEIAMELSISFMDKTFIKNRYFNNLREE